MIFVRKNRKLSPSGEVVSDKGEFRIKDISKHEEKELREVKYNRDGTRFSCYFNLYSVDRYELKGYISV